MSPAAAGPIRWSGIAGAGRLVERLGLPAPDVVAALVLDLLLAGRQRGVLAGRSRPCEHGLAALGHPLLVHRVETHEGHHHVDAEEGVVEGVVERAVQGLAALLGLLGLIAVHRCSCGLASINTHFNKNK